MITGTARIAIRFAVNVEAGKRKLAAVGHIQVKKNLVLLEHRQRIVLVDVAWRTRRGADRIAGAQPERRAGTVGERGIDIARQQLVYAAGIEIRRRDTYTLIHLVLNAGSGFYGGRRVQARLCAIEGR